ncbi:MAG: hypothetical protein ABW252_16815 [Polyangiales bacterium]
MRVELTATAQRAFPLLLAALVVLAYAPVLDAGFLRYDDAWLIADNALLRGPRAAFFDALFDTSRTARLALGAELLPVRDLFVWLETRVFGVSAPPMHAVSIALYVGAVLMLRAALRRVLGCSVWVELTVLLFALHPLHVESVAWLAGQKDVLALALVSAALWAHSVASPRARVLVPLLVLLACFAKAMSVAAIGLLLAQDLLLRRRLDRVLYAVTASITLAALLVHVYVGREVGMIGAPPGGSREAALITMGPVWLRYAAHCLLPLDLSITYHVPDATRWSVVAALGYVFVLGSLLAAARLAQRAHPLALFAWLWFFVPLAPVSQLGAPLQNRMADRYALLSVLAACLLVAWALARLPSAAGRALIAAALTLALIDLTFSRSLLFADEVLLFADAARKDLIDPKPTYHLGRALAEADRDDEAMLAYRETLRRAGSGRTSARSGAAKGLAVLLAERGALDAAIAVLREARPAFPDDPALAMNLAKLLRGVGRDDEAAPLERRFANAAKR